MKLNITVDLSEFYSEEDGATFSQQIKDHIAYMVKQEVLKDFKNKISEEFNREVKKEIEATKEFFITDVLKQLIVSAKVKKRYGTNEMISISEYICEELERVQLTDNKMKDFLTSQTKKSSDEISKELKNRYDLLFASQIVTKLNENGMLKEDVARLLLDK